MTVYNLPVTKDATFSGQVVRIDGRRFENCIFRNCQIIYARHTQNVRALQKLAGHSKIETTMRYIHPDEADVLDIASAVQQARSKRSGVTRVFTTATQEEAQGSRKM